MKNKPDYFDSLRAMLRQAHKEKNAEKAVYYSAAFALSACASWEVFRGAWAYASWVKQNAEAIALQNAEYKRFAYLS